MPLPRLRLATVMAAAALLAAANWLTRPGYTASALLLLPALTLAWRSAGRQASRLLTGLVVILAGIALIGSYRLSSLERTWPEEQRRRTEHAFDRLAAALHGLLSDTERLAEEAERVADLPGNRLFQGLEELLPSGKAEMAVVVFDESGAPVGWAGRTRVDPFRMGDDLTVQFERYHAAFEVRRELSSGRMVLATGLLWVNPAVPRPHRSLLARLGAETGVELRIHPPGDTTGTTEMFDYVLPATAGDRLLFSVEPVPPDSSQVLRQAERLFQYAFCLILLLIMAVGFAGEPDARGRALLLACAAGAWLWSPLGAVVVSDRLFSPASFVLPAIRPFGASAGHLIATGFALLLGAGWLVHRATASPSLTRLVGWLLLLGIPLIAPLLGRGIHPPPLGVEPALWLSWYTAIALPLASLATIGAVLADQGVVRSTLWGSSAAVLAGLGTALLGLESWTPGSGWPWWFPLIWTIPLAISAVLQEKVVRVTLTSGVAAALAAVVTWQADLTGRTLAAEQDYQRLGTVEDPLAEPLLHRLADQVQESSGPTSAAGLYLLWAGSDLAGQEFPVRLSLWDTSRARVADIALDSLDVPMPALASLVREFEPARGRVIHRLGRVPGQHYVLLTALDDQRVMSVVVGPRTRLVVSTRLARILRPATDARPLYDISLSPPQALPDSAAVEAGWKRERGALRLDAGVPFSDGNRHVHVTIPLRGTWMVLAYGLLGVVAVQLLVLGVIGLTLLASANWGGALVRRSVRSFRFRLTVALATFFIVPMLGFTAWGLSRADLENQRARDAAISGVLHNAALSVGDVVGEPQPDLEAELAVLAARLESDLFLYRGGRLVAASHPLLTELGLVEPLQDAGSFQRLSLGDELEMTRQATSYVAPVRVGYRVVLAGSPRSVGILATPQLASDWRRQQIQRDLSVLLVIAVVSGIGAALVGAQVAARGLSSPVAELERSAIAVGAGRELPAPLSQPREFERVFAAFREMAADIRASQAALEGARQRTAAVLSQVATGVVAFEPGGRILLANARAREVLGASLREGEDLHTSLDGEGAPVARAVAAFTRGDAASDAREVERGGRVLRLQFARLSGEPGGVVLAIDDLTDVTQAARVLAWGQMAQQVAHEIKNPLTPIRLGVQHLRRVERERPAALPEALDEITTRILSEIERLDTIARAFSRFAAPREEPTPLEPVDVVEVAREVTALYRLGEGDFTVEVTGQGPSQPARRDELREVLGNLLENARDAGAHRLAITVHADGVELSDDGPGIAPGLLERVFEPRFSTTTSGAGLGLAIVRRLVEGWGARIDIQSAPGRGTTVVIRWPD